MLEDLIVHITRHRNGVKLTFHCGLEKWENLCLDETVDSIIDQVKQGYIDFVFPFSTDGTTSPDSKKDGSNQV